MYKVPSDPSIQKCIISENVILKKTEPEIIYKSKIKNQTETTPTPEDPHTYDDKSNKTPASTEESA
jgi:hypothetical protein